MGTVHLSGLAFAVAAGVRVGDVRRESVVGRGDLAGSADGKESVVAISTSALSSSLKLSRRICTPEARSVSPPLLRGICGAVAPFPCQVGRHCQLFLIRRIG